MSVLRSTQLIITDMCLIFLFQKYVFRTIQLLLMRNLALVSQLFWTSLLVISSVQVSLLFNPNCMHLVFYFFIDVVSETKGGACLAEQCKLPLSTVKFQTLSSVMNIRFNYQ